MIPVFYNKLFFYYYNLNLTFRNNYIAFYNYIFTNDVHDGCLQNVFYKNTLF